MRRRDYELVAQGLRDAYPHNSLEVGGVPFTTDLTVARNAWRRAVDAMAEILHNDNPGFNRALFKHNCGVEAT